MHYIIYINKRKKNVRLINKIIIREHLLLAFIT